MVPNAEFVVYTPPGKLRRASIRITKTVEVGEEILVSYGNDYWRFHLKQAKKKHQPRKRARKEAAEENAVVAAALVLAAVTTRRTVGTVQSELTAKLKSAAAADPKYAELVAKPPPDYTERGGLLTNGTGAIVVPNDQALRTAILAELHDSTTGAHLGRDKTTDAAKARFAWDGMSSDVESYIAGCDSCQRNKPSRQLTPGLLMPLPIPEEPLSEWTTDAVTGLKKTKNGFDAIQVYVERYTKIKHYVAGHKSDGAKELARSFVQTVVRQYGIPTKVVSDRDPRFTAHYYKELTRLLGVTLSMSTARHPQSDGQSEREIGTLTTGLRAFVNDNQDDWDEFLPMFELGINNAVQSSTSKPPHELLYGFKPRLPIDVALAPFRSNNPAALSQAQRMEKAYAQARESLLSAQDKQKRNADRRRRAGSFEVGDAVMLSRDGIELNGADSKLSSLFMGPFRITAVINANSYTLELPPQLKALHPTFNIEKLKRYIDGRQKFPDRPVLHARPPPEAERDSNGQLVYEVERVLASKGANGGREFLVSWRGYPQENNTWEPKSSLENAPEALADFRRSQKNQA